jgi:hypothetical protein
MNNSQLSRKNEAAKRKFLKALQPLAGRFTVGSLDWNFIPRKEAVEIHQFFTFKGTELRFDYSFALTEPLPKVAYIRTLLWSSVNEWMGAHPQLLVDA